MMSTETDSVFSIGQVKQLNIPEGWSKVEQSNPDLSSLVVLTPPDSTAVQLGFYYRGLPISQSDGIAFQTVLQQRKGELMPKDLEGIRGVLADVADPSQFHLVHARVDELNGRVVLIVEGRWQETESDSYEIFIDAGGGGTFVQQIFLLAPKSQFHQQLKTIKESCFNTIEWVD